jgi:hypothetical protein
MDLGWKIMKVREAVNYYYEMGNIPKDGGASDRLFVVKILGVPFVNYNSMARVDAAKIHDVHHAVTGFKTNFRGETQIGAWEVASSCGGFYAAWALNLIAVSMGIFVWPKIVWEAFLLGRHTKNFYKTGVPERVFDSEVSDIRRELGLSDSRIEPLFADRVSFLFWALVATFLHLLLLPFYIFIPLHFVSYKLFFDSSGKMRNYAFLKRTL